MEAAAKGRRSKVSKLSIQDGLRESFITFYREHAEVLNDDGLSHVETKYSPPAASQAYSERCLARDGICLLPLGARHGYLADRTMSDINLVDGCNETDLVCS